MYLCEICNKETEEVYGSGRFCSFSCKQKYARSQQGEIIPDANCKYCNKEFHPKTRNGMFCTRQCHITYQRTNEQYKLECRSRGSKGGKISAQSQQRRSKNEIYFAELCETQYDILTNEPIFNGWDADVIIPDLKIAVLWNGVWHYKKITQKHSLKQVQNRDKIKHNEIVKYGYIPYIIKDLGCHKKKFVEEEFQKFQMLIANKDIFEYRPNLLSFDFDSEYESSDFESDSEFSESEYDYDNENIDSTDDEWISIPVLNEDETSLQELKNVLEGFISRKRLSDYSNETANEIDSDSSDTECESDLKCKECGKQITTRTKNQLCRSCWHLSTRKVERPPRQQLLDEVKEMGFLGTGRKYGVSDNAIRKWLRYVS